MTGTCGECASETRRGSTIKILSKFGSLRDLVGNSKTTSSSALNVEYLRITTGRFRGRLSLEELSALRGGAGVAS